MSPKNEAVRTSRNVHENAPSGGTSNMNFLGFHEIQSLSKWCNTDILAKEQTNNYQLSNKYEKKPPNDTRYNKTTNTSNIDTWWGDNICNEAEGCLSSTLEHVIVGGAIKILYEV